MGEKKKAIVQVEMSGSAYCSELEDEIAALMPEDVSFTVHGEKVPAAGPDLLINVVLEFVVPAVRDWVIGEMLTRMMDCVRRRLGHKPELSRVVVSCPQYELRVVNKSFLDESQACPSWSDMDQIVERAGRMVERELAHGRTVTKVTVPCRIEKQADQVTLCAVGVGDADTWLIEYSGANPPRAYDSTSESFIKVDGVTYPYGA